MKKFAEFIKRNVVYICLFLTVMITGGLIVNSINNAKIEKSEAALSDLDRDLQIIKKRGEARNRFLDMECYVYRHGTTAALDSVISPVWDSLKTEYYKADSAYCWHAWYGDFEKADPYGEQSNEILARMSRMMYVDKHGNYTLTERNPAFEEYLENILTKTDIQ